MSKISTIAETLLNLIISISLVHKFGLAGVLLGTIISYFMTVFIQKAYYIYKNIFEKNPIHYFASYLSVVFITIAIIFIVGNLELSFNNVISWIIYVIFGALILGIILLIIFYVGFKSFRNLFKRGIEFIKVKGNYIE